MNSIYAKSAAAIAAATLAVAAQAGPLLYLSTSSNELATVDATTGAVSLIGSTGVFLTDIAFSPTGQLYGISFGELYSVNKSTGASTLIGSHGISANANALIFGADGTLYGAGSGLYSINTSTGAGTLIGAMGFQSAGDLAFVGGNLFLAADTGGNDSLVQVNLGTGAGTLVGGMGFDNVFGLASPDNVTLYGLAGTSVLGINPGTGAASLVANFNPAGVVQGTAAGTAFFTEAGAAVPEPASYALVAVGLLGLALTRKNRRSR